MSIDVANAKNELAAAYARLGTALQSVSHAAQNFGVAIGHLGPAELADLDGEAIAALVNPVLAGQPAAGLPVAASALHDHDAGEGGEDGKKKRKSREKKPKDPNMPKRPPSAYLLFQNAVRQEYRDREPSDTPYAEVLRKISHAWQSMNEEERSPWINAQEENLRNYELARDSYFAANPERAPKSWEEGRRASDIQVGGSGGDTGTGTTISKTGTEYPGKKRGRKSKAEKEAIEAERLAQAALASASAAGPSSAPAAAPVVASAEPVKSKKEKKDKKEKKKQKEPSPIPPPAVSSTEDSEESDDSSDEDSDELDSDSSEDSAPKNVSPSKKIATPSGDKHKSKKNKH